MSRLTIDRSRLTRRVRFVPGVAPLALAAMGCMSPSEAGNSSPATVTVQASQAMRANSSSLKAIVRRSPTVVEIEVTSSTPFLNGAIPPVLVIGDKAFGLSRTPPDGRNTTMIFLLTASEFDALVDAKEVSVGYLGAGAIVTTGQPPQMGRANAAAVQFGPEIRPDRVTARRRVGQFNKSLLEVTP
jgi:hypothetical protein